MPNLREDLLWLHPDEIVPDPVNPNTENPPTFNALVDAIRETGFLEPIEVRLVDDRYMIVAGEHRWKAAQVIGLERIPAVLVEGMDDADEATKHMVRSNVIRGGLDPVKFKRVFDALAAKYGEAEARRSLGRTSDALFRRVYRDVARKLGAPVSAEAVARIESMDDLALMLNTLYAQFGGTLAQHFMVLSFGGKMHAMIRLDDDGWAAASKWLDELKQTGEDANVALVRLLRKPRAKKD